MGSRNCDEIIQNMCDDRGGEGFCMDEEVSKVEACEEGE